MKLILFILILLAGIGSEAAGLQSEFATGRAYYSEGEFKKAASHFQLALNADPNDAEFYYWTGMSYQVLADIASPFNRKYNSKARVYLTTGDGTRARPIGLPPGTIRLSFGLRRLLAGRMAAGCRHSADCFGIRSGLYPHAPAFRAREKR